MANIAVNQIKDLLDPSIYILDDNECHAVEEFMKANQKTFEKNLQNGLQKLLNGELIRRV